MRLLNVQVFLDAWQKPHQEGTLFRTIARPSDADYAILSHRWASTEFEKLNFKKLKKFHHRPFESLMEDPKYQISGLKIKGAFTQARDRGLGYIWIDSCCIDRSNQVEVNKSIRSMFAWYRMARVCFSYLSDVEWSIDDNLKSEKAFKESEWFGRAWTLQELLAPSIMHLFACDWQSIGTREALSSSIQEASGIDAKHLEKFNPHSHKASIARKLSWLANRRATEEEDKVYCLFGILNVSIDPRYGEGLEEAFLRLQERLIQTPYSDESLFAWQSNTLKYSGLLAPSSNCFKGLSNVELRPENISQEVLSRWATRA